MNLLSLCDISGAWSDPYLLAGWDVVRVDLQYPRDSHHPGNSERGMLICLAQDVLTFQPEIQFDVVLAAPPCTCFCRPGSQWWKKMDDSGETVEHCNVMRRCLEICKTARRFWALENPPGRHRKLIPELGKFAWQYQPWEFGDPWTKQTYIWGTAVKPVTTPVCVPKITYRTPNGKTQGRISRMSSSWKREREKTPPGFAKAFFEANQ